jgi:hypothetical protein
MKNVISKTFGQIKSGSLGEIQKLCPSLRRIRRSEEIQRQRDPRRKAETPLQREESMERLENVSWI